MSSGAFALLLDDAVDLLAGLLYEILDTGRVNAAVGDQLLERETRDLAAHGIEA